MKSVLDCSLLPERSWSGSFVVKRTMETTVRTSEIAGGCLNNDGSTTGVSALLCCTERLQWRAGSLFINVILLAIEPRFIMYRACC